MKTVIAIAISLMLVLASPVAAAEQESFTVLFSGGPEDNRIEVDLSEDGRSYVIDSIARLEVGGGICAHPEENPYQLVCEATAISGFEVNANAGDDVVTMSRTVPVPVTLRGGPGDDRLFGGSGHDKIVGGAGDDVLVGRVGDDRLYGGPGRDKLVGAAGADLLRGGTGHDRYFPGKGKDRIVKKRPTG
ncbi:MAG: hypothetical protein R2725_11075 [Solirubrobacterales bacterium]